MVNNIERDYEKEDEADWPPGTIRIELLLPSKSSTEIILQPRPSTDPNDPLVGNEVRDCLTEFQG